MMNKKLIKRMIDNINNELDDYIESEYDLDEEAVADLVVRKISLSMMLEAANDN